MMRAGIVVVFVSICAVGRFATAGDEQTPRPGVVAFTPGRPDTLLYDAGAISPNGVRLLTTGEETGGAWSLVELTEMPGTKTTWHRHNFDQSYYVREGTFTAKVADKVYELPPGGYIFIPRGMPHGTGNFGDVPVKVLLTNAPAGFEWYFHARAELLKIMKPDHPEFRRQMRELRKKYQTEELGVWEIPAR